MADVNKIYSDIFQKDPLLLLPKSQALYGEQILKNLLLDRPNTSKSRQHVDLNDPTSRAEFKAEPTPGRIALNAAEIEDYRSSRLGRRALADAQLGDDLEQITMMSKGERTQDRSRIDKDGMPKASFAIHKDALKSDLSSMQSRLRFAAIGYRVAISVLREDAQLNEVLSPRKKHEDIIELEDIKEGTKIRKMRRTRFREVAQIDQWRRDIESHIRRALAAGAHFIVLPEFALPPKHDENDSAIEEAISTAAANADPNHSFFLFSGSRHEGPYNRGFVLVRQENRKKTLDRWWHYKLASARSLGENIMGPQQPRCPAYRFVLPSPKGGRRKHEFEVVIAICVDIFDPTTFINYVINAALAERDRYKPVILVPSFNPAKEFLHALRDLSFLAACPVIYVNALHGDAKLFLFGIDMSDLEAIEPQISASTPEPATSPSAPEHGSSSLFSQLTDLLNDLDNQRAELTESHRRQKDIDSRRLPADVRELLDANIVRLYSELEVIDQRIAAVASLKNNLTLLRDRGAFKNIITIEHCADCDAQNHGGIYYCAGDVLYYNLDIELLDLLERFRASYFADDTFLPKPFRRDQLRQLHAAIKLRDAKKEDRFARRSRRPITG